MGDETGGPQRLGRLMDGYLSTQLVYLAARLGIADALSSPRTTSAGSATSSTSAAGSAYWSRRSCGRRPR
jgi:hypothetical protein